MYASTVLGTVACVAAGVQAQSSLNSTGGYINYTTVTGYFLQDVSTTNASTFDYVGSIYLKRDMEALTDVRLPPTSASSTARTLRRMALPPTTPNGKSSRPRSTL